jgi:hypothetical protein
MQRKLSAQFLFLWCAVSASVLRQHDSACPFRAPHYPKIAADVVKDTGGSAAGDGDDSVDFDRRVMKAISALLQQRSVDNLLAGSCFMIEVVHTLSF